jgi:hypothetical protein
LARAVRPTSFSLDETFHSTGMVWRRSLSKRPCEGVRADAVVDEDVVACALDCLFCLSLLLEGRMSDRGVRGDSPPEEDEDAREVELVLFIVVECVGEME